MNTQNDGFKHGEAFMHMKYVGATNAGSIQLRIWNSRDGVTPFMTLKEFLADKEKYIADAVNEMLHAHGEPQPRLQLVEEDWK